MLSELKQLEKEGVQSMLDSLASDLWLGVAYQMAGPRHEVIVRRRSQ